MSDAINPSHYKQGKVECIDAIDAATSNLKGLEAVCTANIIKYVWRWKLKNGAQDLRKAQWYLDTLLSLQNTQNVEDGYEQNARLDREERG